MDMEQMPNEEVRRLIYEDISRLKTSRIKKEEVEKNIGGIMVNCAGEIDIPAKVTMPSGPFVDKPA